jgi:hypothetical protein
MVEAAMVQQKDSCYLGALKQNVVVGFEHSEKKRRAY